MKKIFSLLFLIAPAMFFSQSYVMDNNSVNLACPSTSQFFDSGGSGGVYANNENFTKTFTAPAGSCLQVVFSSFASESCCDRLRIFDGASGASPLVGTYAGSTSPGTIVSSGSSLTFSFTSDGSITGNGWSATITCVVCSTVSSGSPYVMNNTSVNLTCPSTSIFYDSGGSGGSYQNSENFTKTFTAPAGSCLQVVFGSFATESCCDRLRIYDGTNGSAPILGTFAGSTNPGTITSTGSSLTFSFTSDGSVVAAGWDATITCVVCTTVAAGSPYLMNNTNVTLTCPSTSLFYDSGGSNGDYSNSENFTKTFTAPAGSCLQVAFNTTFGTESCCDRLKVFDGANGSSPLIGTYNGTSGPGTIVSSGTSLTFSFTSDGSIVSSGWDATITCVSACSGAPSGGTASNNTGGSCPVSGSVQLSVAGNSSGCGLTYQWQSSATSTGPWTNVSGATSSTVMVATSTNYYRLVTSCGTNSAASTAVQAVSGAFTSPCSLSTYTVASTTYSFETFAGSTLPTTDDVLYNTIVYFGFPFCFGGSQHWGGYVASNGALVFGAVPCFPNISTSTYAAGGVATGYTIPSAAPVNSTSIPRNAILGPWHDIDPSQGGNISYYSTGTAPNRRFVVSFNNVAMFSCTTLSFTGQIKLFETTNAIEIHVGNKVVCSTFNGGKAVLGLHNHDGTIYVPPVNATAHNSPTQWTMSNTAYKFESPCAVNNGPCVILPINFKSFYGEHVNGINKLYWSTSEEKNIKHFIIERSTDAINFSPVGYALPNNKASEYSFNDENIKSATIYYYKITAEENDGQRKSTFVYPLGGTDESSITEIFPNPADNTFSIGLINKEPTPLTISIKDMFGRVVFKSDHDTPVGATTVSLNAPATSGVYIVEVHHAVTGKILSVQKLAVTR